MVVGCGTDSPACLPDAPDDTSDGGSDTAAETDSADTGAPPAARCPDGMVGMPSGAPVLCVDAYEVTVVGGVARALAGQVPTVGLSFDDARRACAATDALDALGQAYAPKRLVTSDEWEDIGDGVLGSGGTAYPYGDTWSDTACATPTATGTVTLGELQPTGAYPSCVSAFGAYDLVGNAWEWTDPGMRVDVTAAMAARAAEGQSITVGEDDVLSLVTGSPERLLLAMAGVDGGPPERDAQGRLGLSRERIQPAPADWVGMGGYLVPSERADAPSDFLPVRIYPADPADLEGPWLLHLYAEIDGAPITDKRGCAYYTGNERSCALTETFFDHLSDFRGTIGFRCAVEPYLAER